MTDRPIRVLCVDDNALVGDALRIALARAGGFEWCGLLSDANTLIGEVERRRPEVMVLDLDMPGTDAMRALENLSAVCPSVRTVVYSGYVSDSLVDRAFDAGAWGYVSKGEDVGTIIDAVRRVAAGSVVLGPEVERACNAGPR